MSKKKIAILLVLAAGLGLMIYGVIKPSRDRALEHQRTHPGKHAH